MCGSEDDVAPPNRAVSTQSARAMSQVRVNQSVPNNRNNPNNGNNDDEYKNAEAADHGGIVVPRPFKLRIEAEAAAGKKGKSFMKDEHRDFISYGLHSVTKSQNENEKFDVVGYWQGIIIGIQGAQCGEQMYSFVIKVPPQYPDVPPSVRFSTKIILPFVDQKGYVHVGKIAHFKWDAFKNIADVLMAIRDGMKDKQYIQASSQVVGQQFFNEQSGDNIEKNFV